jgi:hypothetical protein
VLLREYLYVDTTAVKGILAQLDSGVVESEASTTGKTKKSGGGIKGFAEHAQDWGDSRTTTKVMGDALFPSLEDTLETEGLLTDASDTVANPDIWTGGSLEELLPPGKIVRVTAPGYLIDARFVATVLGGFSTTYRGLVNMGILPATAPPGIPPKVKKAVAKPRYKELPGEADSPEGVIPSARFTSATTGHPSPASFFAASLR